MHPSVLPQAEVRRDSPSPPVTSFDFSMFSRAGLAISNHRELPSVALQTGFLLTGFHPS